jgi:putative ABC transport system permease protein
MALGAPQRQILTMVLNQGARQVGLGLFLGVGVALALATAGGTAIANTLFNVSAHDPLTYVAVVVMIVAVSLVAVLVPGRRAARVDPMVALRTE